MRLKLFSLTKTPVWVFFCFLTVVFLLSPVESYALSIPNPFNWIGLGGTGQAVVNGAYNSHILTDTMNTFQSSTEKWQTHFEEAAESLFWLLVPIAMVWRFGQIAMQGGGATEALAELVRFLIFVGFYFWLLENGTEIAKAIVYSIEKIASGAVGSEQQCLDPSKVINLGFDTARDIFNVVKKSSFSIKEIPAILTTFLVTILFEVICAIVAINLLLAIISTWFLMYAGVFILGFGATSWTSEMAIGYFRTVFAAAMRVMGMMLIIGVCADVIKTIASHIGTDIVYNLSQQVELLVAALMMYLLSEKIPDQLASLTSGSLGSNHAAVSNAGSFATAQMAAGLAISAATGGAGAVAKMAASRVAGDAASDIASRMIPGSSGSGEMGSIKGGSAPTSAAKPAPSASQKASNDDASHYIHGVDFANLKYPNPNAPAPSND